jgi:GNAT superfamily N-acetyltransferase
MQYNLFTVSSITPSTQSFDNEVVIYNTAQLTLIEKEMKLEIKWTYNLKNINWEDLIELYRIAPLGIKDPEKLKTTFTNSLFKCFAYDGADCSYICDIALHPEYQGLGFGKVIVQKLVELSRGHKKIILYSNPGKEEFYLKLGFKRVNTAMAIFDNESDMIENGTISS